MPDCLVRSGNLFSSSPAPHTCDTLFRRSAIKVLVEYEARVDGVNRVRHFYEYGVVLGFMSLQPFAGLPRCSLAKAGYFQQEHAHVSGLVLVKGFKVRHDDRFLSVADIENTPVTLNNTRSCDPPGWSHSTGSYVALEF